MSYDDDFLPISALQHLLFCPRQCALIQIEREWEENVFTARGRLEHDRVHQGYKEVRRGKRQFSGLSIRSEALQLQGKLDVLELELLDGRGQNNMSSFGLCGSWCAFPVEFKHGEPKENDCDRVQLCAQAVCLEEMYGLSIDTASLFYYKIRRREDVVLDESLRIKTMRAAAELQRLINDGRTPAPIYSAKCRVCSLVEVCLPKKVIKSNRHYRQVLFQPQEPMP
jgi:CRISPR-associated exonuclease Cas4